MEFLMDGDCSCRTGCIKRTLPHWMDRVHCKLHFDFWSELRELLHDTLWTLFSSSLSASLPSNHHQWTYWITKVAIFIVNKSVDLACSSRLRNSAIFCFFIAVLNAVKTRLLAKPFCRSLEKSVISSTCLSHCKSRHFFLPFHFIICQAQILLSTAGRSATFSLATLSKLLLDYQAGKFELVHSSRRVIRSSRTAYQRAKDVAAT